VEGLRVVNVFVAQSTISSGTQVEQAVHDGSLSTEKLPVSSVPPNAVESITPALAGLVTSATVQAGQLLLKPMLVTAAQVTGGIAIPVGKMAVAIQLCVPEAVAGYVTPGSYVAVFDTTGIGSSQLQRTCDTGHQATPSATRIVLLRAEVLSVGQAPAQGSSSSSTSTAADGPASSASSQQGVMLVTLALSQADTERLISIAETGLPYLALLTSSSKTSFGAAPSLFQSSQP